MLSFINKTENIYICGTDLLKRYSEPSKKKKKRQTIPNFLLSIFEKPFYPIILYHINQYLSEKGYHNYG